MRVKVPGTSDDYPGYAAAPLTAANFSPTLLGSTSDDAVGIKVWAAEFRIPEHIRYRLHLIGA